MNKNLILSIIALLLVMPITAYTEGGSSSAKRIDSANSEDGVLGEVVLFSGLNQAWFFVYDRKRYVELSEKSKQKNKNAKERLILIELYGVKDVPLKRPIDESNKQQKIISDLGEKLKGHTSSLKCYRFSNETGSPICEMISGNNNIGLGLIEFGYSPLIISFEIDEKTTKKYEAAQSKAKDSGIGIWEPFYGLFDIKDR